MLLKGGRISLALCPVSSTSTAAKHLESRYADAAPNHYFDSYGAGNCSEGRNANLFEHLDEWLGCSISHTQVSATQLTAAQCNGHRSAARWRVNELV